MTADEADTAFSIEVETGSSWSATLVGSNHAVAVGVQTQKQTAYDDLGKELEELEDILSIRRLPRSGTNPWW